MNLVETFRTRMLLGLQTNGGAIEAYLLPTAGTSVVNIRALATMGNAADVVATVKYADDASGTNATAFDDVPVYVNGVRQSTDSETYTVTAATGNFILDWVVDPGLIPAGKYIGVHFAASNAGNIVASKIFEDVAYKPTAT